ncbi:MAG TPA: PEGA domain-containing protein [Polyangia bacterium]
MRTVLGGVALCVLLAATAGPALARPSRPKMAALILKTGNVDEELADNLTEVLISRLARRGDHEISGKEELKSKLGVDDRAAADCMSNPGCLGRVGTELGVTRMVVGTLGKRGDDYVYNLNLIDIETGKVENRVFEMVAGGRVQPLIAAVQSTADKLLEPKVEPGAVRVTSETRGAMVYLDEAFMGSTPVRREGVEPGPHALRVEKEGHVGWAKEIEVPAGATMEVKVPLGALIKRRTWPGPAAASMAVLAGLSGVVGIVLDALALQPTTAATRAGAIQDANARFVESFAGNVFLGAAAVLAVTAAIITIAYRHDIFGSTQTERAAEKPRASIRPYGLAGFEVRW